MILDYSSDRSGRYFAIKFSNGNIKELISSVEVTWEKVFSNYALEYFFMDDDFDRQYKQEDQLANVLTVFAVIILIISGIGLIGLVAFMSLTRTKEVGIRKTLGASAIQIVYLFVKDFIILVLIGNLLSIPVIWYLGNDWLQEFAYRTQISASIFVWSILITVFLALVMISIQTVKTARMNPVRSLRYE